MQEQAVTPRDTSPSPDATTAAARQASSSIVFGSVAAAMAIWLLPYVFGPVGVVFGVNALLHGDRRGRWVIVVAVLGLVLGLIVNVIPDHILFSGS